MLRGAGCLHVRVLVRGQRRAAAQQGRRAASGIYAKIAAGKPGTYGPDRAADFNGSSPWLRPEHPEHDLADEGLNGCFTMADMLSCTSSMSAAVIEIAPQCRGPVLLGGRHQVYGQSPGLRDWLEDQQIAYVMAMPCSEMMTVAAGRRRVTRWLP